MRNGGGLSFIFAALMVLGMTVSICESVGPPLWTRTKYLKDSSWRNNVPKFGDHSYGNPVFVLNSVLTSCWACQCVICVFTSDIRCVFVVEPLKAAYIDSGFR